MTTTREICPTTASVDWSRAIVKDPLGLQRHCTGLSAMLAVLAPWAALAAGRDAAQERSAPVIQVTKEVYVRHPAPGVAAEVKSYY